STPQSAPADERGLGAHRPRRRADPRRGREALRQVRGACADAGAEPRAAGAAGGAAAALAQRQTAEPALRLAGANAPAALPGARERPEPRDPRLRLLDRERDSEALRARRHPRLDRLRAPLGV